MKPETDIYSVIGVVIFPLPAGMRLTIVVKQADKIVSFSTCDCPSNLTLSFIKNEVRKKYDIKKKQVYVPYYISETIKKHG